MQKYRVSLKRYSKMQFSFQDLKSNIHMYGAAAALSFVELQS